MTISKTTINIIGGGRVGRTLGHLLYKEGIAEVNQVFCRNARNAEEACNFIGSGEPITSLEDLTQATINIVSTRDDAIRVTSDKIARESGFNFKSMMFIHCSGAMSAKDGLSSLGEKGALIASCHPAISFSSPGKASEIFRGAYCGIEGDDMACLVMSKIFDHIGFRSFHLSSSQKDLYHAACVASNNFIYALGHMATKMFKTSGVDQSLPKELTVSIMKNALDNLGALDFKDVLSGPIARGDVDTISKHKNSIKVFHDLNIENIFRDLGEYCLSNLTEHSGDARRLIRSAII